MTTEHEDRKMKALGGRCWMAHKPGEYPNVEVAFTRSGLLKVMSMESDINAYSFRLDRKTARLLAKRINEALDDWADA